MQSSLILLLSVTVLYAGYNLLIKASADLVPDFATSTILATITLQVAALAISCIFAAGLLIRGDQSLALPIGAYLWAAAAGLCIGAAEIGYFYLFRSNFDGAPMLASLAIPFIVGGTILIAIAVSWIVFREHVSWLRLLGAAFVVGGIALMFAGKSSA